MSEVGTLLRTVAGEDEWSRHAALERLRVEGLDSSGLSELREALKDDADASRRSAARMMLAALAAPESPDSEAALDLLRDSLGSRNADLRVLAASALGETGNHDAGADLIAALRDPDSNVVAAAADALGVLGHAAAIAPLSELGAEGDFWARAAAIVSLGRIRDARAIPVLARVAAEPGLEEPAIEALRVIGDPRALPVLEELATRAPIPALLAAGSILCAHPDVGAPGWVADRATSAAGELGERLEAEDDPAAARLLGIAAPPGALDDLLDRVPPHGSSEAAVAGVLAASPEPRADAILGRLQAVDAESRVTLLSLLPPLTAEAQIRRLLPFLDDPDSAVRAAAAASLGRAPAEGALPLLRAQLERKGAVPEVLRAMGGLGPDACLALAPLLDDPDPDVRCATADALTRCGGADTAGRLAEALDREDDRAVLASLLRAYGHVAAEGSVDRLADALSHPALEVRLAAIEGLAATGSPVALHALREPLAREAPENLAALRALGDLADPAGARLLEPFLASEDRDLRRTAAGAAVRLAGALPLDTLVRLSRDDDEWVRICAARALARAGAGGRDRLLELRREDPSAAVREETSRVLQGVE